jgi:hypothetical protein
MEYLNIDSLCKNSKPVKIECDINGDIIREGEEVFCILDSDNDIAGLICSKCDGSEIIENLDSFKVIKGFIKPSEDKYRIKVTREWDKINH